MNKSNIEYISSFDGLRALSLIIVMLSHVNGNYFIGGWIGVDVFFVLSGYLITSLLQNEFNKTGKVNLLRFYFSRLLRLSPPLIICIIISYFLWEQPSKMNEANFFISTWAAILYSVNLLKLTLVGNFGHLWSLSVEEHYYLLWPISFLLLSRIKFKNRLIILIFLVICSELIRILIYLNENLLIIRFLSINSYRFTLGRMDNILLGSILAIVLDDFKGNINQTTKIPKKALYSVLLICYVFVIYFVNHSDFYWNMGGFILTNFLALSTVYYCILNSSNPLLSSKVLRYFGKRSYGIYIYHYSIFLYLDNFRLTNNDFNYWWLLFLKFSISILIAEISFRYIESPILKLKKYII